MADDAAALARVTFIKDGPIRIRGAVDLRDHLNAPIAAAGNGVVLLCRCGHSAKKPFCDGSHARVGFRSGADRMQ
jgi:CDGSH iron-sulfur domain-containing protein 3